jgi:hypothetical protein
VFADWPAAGIEEATIVINRDGVRDAVQRAIVLGS